MTGVVGRRGLLATPLAAAAAPAQEPGLREIAAARGIAFGTMVANHHLAAQPKLLPLILQEAAFITPGLELKWEKLRPGPEAFDFSGSDALMALARAHDLGVYGHTLVWHVGLPAWFNPRMPAAAMRQVLQAHIRRVAGHHAGQLVAWDVVNEAIDPYDRRPDGLRATPFLLALGPEYIRLALEWAAEADPAARLVINDYDLELDDPHQDRRRAAMLRLLESLKARGVPLHALGIQAHLAPRSAPLNPAKLRRFLSDVAALGLEIAITELDIVDRLLPGPIPARDAEAAAMLRDFLAVVVEEPAVTRIALWGLSDSQGWQDDSAFVRRRDGLPARGQPYDAQLRPKPARAAIAAALRSRPSVN